MDDSKIDLCQIKYNNRHTQKHRINNFGVIVVNGINEGHIKILD